MEHAPKPSAVADKRRRSALSTMVTSWLLPATTARHTAHVSLKEAYLVHLMAAVLAVMLINVLIALGETDTPVTLQRVLSRVQVIPYGLMYSLAGFGRWFVLAVLGTALGIELGFVALAFIIMSWGARDEPVRASFRHAVVRTWLQTAHVLPLILLVGGPTVALDNASRNWHVANPRPQWPQRPVNAALGSQVRKEYDEAKRQYAEQMEKWLEAKPWYVDNVPSITADVVVLAGVWFLWALLRSVGVPRSVPPIVRPRTCEACGYNLTSIPMDSRCPECGEDVVLSLGPSVRSGTMWEHTPKGNRCVAWWRCSNEAVSIPATLGRRLRHAPPEAAHRRLWVIHLPIAFLLAPLAVIIIIFLEVRNTGRPPPRESIRAIGMMVVALGALTATFLLFLGLLTASVMGIVVGFRQKRNLMPYSMQMVSYLGGYFVVWVAFAGALGVGVYLLAAHGWLEALEALVGINERLLALLTWFLPNCVWGIWYLVLVARGTAAARYANR